MRNRSLTLTNTEDVAGLSEILILTPETPTFAMMSPKKTKSALIFPTPPFVNKSGIDDQVLSVERGDWMPGSNDRPVQRKHERFYFDDGNVTFLISYNSAAVAVSKLSLSYLEVEGALYRVHRYFFQRDSSHFVKILMHRQSSTSLDRQSPIPLDDVSCSEFDALLSIFYPLNFHECEVKTVTAWAAVLRLSSEWSFSSIRALAIDRLDPIASAVDKVVLGRTYGIDAWLRPGFVALCERQQSLKINEGRRLGVDDVILIATIREAMQVRRPGVSRSDVEHMVKTHLEPSPTLSPEVRVAGEKSRFSDRKSSAHLVAPKLASVSIAEVEKEVKARANTEVRQRAMMAKAEAAIVAKVDATKTMTVLAKEADEQVTMKKRDSEVEGPTAPTKQHIHRAVASSHALAPATPATPSSAKLHLLRDDFQLTCHFGLPRGNLTHTSRASFLPLVHLARNSHFSRNIGDNSSQDICHMKD
ncbi:hypothetical protein EVG20_g6604 [Dentipellis fragilis]|uniref:BTB domain-containing protein n=1 Tax=Dentipellis fragilis TaxID=205917 RepID=A0A4Y9YK02_9AGAM|nr:hypothetical protein EVG20_g6604 [Dentipellis fragilis]